MSGSPSEGWILTGMVDGELATPAPLTSVAGMPHLLRDACAVAAAGVEQIFVIWTGPSADAPDLARLADDHRLAGRRLVLVDAPPSGDDESPILLVRGDRIFHRDFPKAVASAVASPAVHTIAGDDAITVAVAPRRTARHLAEAATRSRGLAVALAADDSPKVEVDAPWLGFSMAAPDRRSLARAERRLIASLRKQADGIASRFVNRYLSLLLTRLLAPTPILPNHVTLVCLLLAVAGGIVIGQGGYRAAALGFFLVELGSIIDGTDGELSRLKYRFSRLGQWMDTVTDDLSNICFITGTMLNLDQAGVTWAVPVGLTALITFFLTQTTQYLFIALVYRSGDLAAIPWAFQSTESLSAWPDGLIPRIKAVVPRMLKRDFTLTVFLALALVGRIDVILLFFAAGALSFGVAFLIQLLRHQPWRSAPAP